MYLFFLTIFLITSISLITLIIILPNRNNIMSSPITEKNINNRNINLNLLKDTLNYTITILSIIFFITTIILNNLNNTNIKNNNFLNKNNITKNKK